jgi:hypothetical protein
MPQRPGFTAGALGPTCALLAHTDTEATPERVREGEGRGKRYIANQNTCVPGNAGEPSRSGYASGDKCSLEVFARAVLFPVQGLVAGRAAGVEVRAVAGGRVA